MIHVIGFDVGNNAHHWQQVQEGCIALICLDDQVTPLSQSGITAHTIKDATHNKSGILPRLCKNRGQKTRGGGLSMRPGNGDPIPMAHELSEHFRSGDNRNTSRFRSHKLRVIRTDCAGCHQHINPSHVRFTVTDVHSDTESPKPVKYRALLKI